MRNIEITHEEQVPDILDWALAGGKKLSITGSGSKISLGRPMVCDGQLRMSGLVGIELHEPSELVMQAKTGTKLVDIKKELAKVDQELAFAPPDFGPLLGVAPGLSTIGGVFACNLSGSKRIKAGAARDHLLGVQGFSGRGQPFKAGGRVMKNVTGYDLCKLVTGSYGTLVACTSFTFKVLPRPEKARTVLIFGLDTKAAVEAMRDAMSSIHEVSATAYLPKDIAANSGVGYIEKEDLSVVAIKVEGPAPSAEYRCQALCLEMTSRGKVEELHGKNSEKLWNFVSDVKAFVADQSTSVWKISLPPASVTSYLDRVKPALLNMQYYLDWAGGLIWISVPEGVDFGGEPIIRENLKGEGHATLIRGTAELRREVAPFQPQSTALAALTEKVRDGFDPNRIFNPGRMYRVEG